jgi:hypothetical protein
MSVIATALKHMLAAGMPHDVIVAAVAEMEAHNPAEVEAEAKRAKDRERKRVAAEAKRNSVESVESVETPPPPPSPIPLDPPSQTHPPIIPQTPSTTETKRARRLADDWVLPASWGRWAVGEGYSEAIIRLQADQFADFWKAKAGKDAAKLDWEATWRNWMRKVPKVGRNFGTPAPKPKSEFMQHQDDVQRELDKVLGRKRDDEFTGNTLDLETGNWRAH